MNLTPEYLEEQRKCIIANYSSHKFWKGHKVIKNRYETLQRFCKNAKTILCVGSGAVEPIALNATHACDVHEIAGEILEKQGWKGHFFISSCDKIEALDKEFDAAVCSEVIEHLPDLETVKRTFFELDRVSERWIVTTPARKIDDPGHKRVFNFNMLLNVTEGLKCKLVKKDNYWWIYNNERKIFN